MSKSVPKNLNKSLEVPEDAKKKKQLTKRRCTYAYIEQVSCFLTKYNGAYNDL